MKKVILLLYVVLMFTACSEKSVLNEPVANNEISFLKLQETNAQLAKNVEFSALIDGRTGGKIAINHSYVTSRGKSIQITGSLEIPAYSFTGIKTIKINLNDVYAFVNFSPSPFQFNIPLKLNLQYKGLDLYGIDKNRINFYYISDDFKRLELINVQSKIVDFPNGVLGVIKAELKHFSRFGWVI